MNKNSHMCAVHQRWVIICHMRGVGIHCSNIPQRSCSRYHRQKCAVGVRGCCSPAAAALIHLPVTPHAVVCCILRVISGGVFEALLVLYGGVSGSIPSVEMPRAHCDTFQTAAPAFQYEFAHFQVGFT